MPSSVTPDQALQKVLKISRLNGWSVALFAGFCALITVLLGDLTGILVSLMVVASGMMEVRGNRMLCRRNPDGMRWLIRSQLFLLSVILIYAVTRIVGSDRELATETLSPAMRDALQQLELKPDDILPLARMVVRVFYGAVMLATCLYQGGLAFYYSRRKALVEKSLAAPPPLPSNG